MSVNFWFTSDQHFYHKNILNLAHRPFSSVEEMNEKLIENWNSRVKKNDIVYVLGDFIWNTTTTTQQKDIVTRLNGRKILIIGNHDRITTIKAINIGFLYACHEAKIKIGDRYFLLSHYPYRPTKLFTLKRKIQAIFFKKFRYRLKHVEHRPISSKLVLLHGHTHQKNKIKGNQVHIGVDSWDFFPVSANEILSILN